MPSRSVDICIIRAIRVMGFVIASVGLVSLAPGCGVFGGASEEEPVVVARTDSGEPITWDGLDALTRAFADRQVGLIYSATQELAGDDASADERAAARTLLADLATNMYNIASAENVFNRVLDFAVITALLHREWGEQGRARGVFGENGVGLVEAFKDAAGDARSLARRVLDDDQLRVLDDLVESWHERNPRVDEVSFVRFAQFATGESRPDAERLLSLGAVLFAEIGDAGEALDDASRVLDRALYRLEREATLSRWQVAAAKADALATPEVGNAFDQIGGLGDRLGTLPGDIGSEIQRTMSTLGERLPEVNGAIDNADRAIDNARAGIGEADALAASIRNASESVRQTLDSASTLFEEHGADDREGFDIARYERTAEDVASAAERIDAAIASARDLLGSADLRQGANEISGVMDEALDTAAEESGALLDALFWRAVVLLGLFFVLLVASRAVSLSIVRRYGPARHEPQPDPPEARGARAGA